MYFREGMEKNNFFHFIFPLKSARFLRELGNETYTFYHLWNHFRILNARIVQSVESVWTVLNHVY